jgi:hypothetical protein
MRIIRTCALVIVLACSAYAGDIGNPIAPGDIGNPIVSQESSTQTVTVTQIVVDLLQSVLSLH